MELEPNEPTSPEVFDELSEQEATPCDNADSCELEVIEPTDSDVWEKEPVESKAAPCDGEDSCELEPKQSIEPEKQEELEVQSCQNEASCELKPQESTELEIKEESTQQEI